MKPRQPKSIQKFLKPGMVVLWDKFCVYCSVHLNILDDFRSIKGKILSEMTKKREKSNFFHFEIGRRQTRLYPNSLKIVILLHYDLVFKNRALSKKFFDNFRFYNRCPSGWFLFWSFWIPGSLNFEKS